MAKGSVYVTMDTIKGACPAFQKGKACPYNVPELKNLARSRCPAFKDGCPFENVKDVGEFRNKLAEMGDKCKGKANHHKAFELIWKVNVEKFAELGHCSFNKYGCQVKEDLESQPITNDFVELDYVKNNCPVFQKGKFCPYDIPCLKGLGVECPEFKNGCPFKNVKTIGELKAKLGDMREKCKGKANNEKAINMIVAAGGKQMGKFGHCPFFKFGCMLKTDDENKPILPKWYTMEYIEEHCPSFQKGKFCPYNMPGLKGLAKGCPAFKDGCPFKHVKTVGEFEGKLAKMRNECTSSNKYGEALKIIYDVNGAQSAKLGHCPFFKFGCPFKTDRQGKLIVPELVSLNNVQQYCPVFKKGHACPYDVKELGDLSFNCPEFKKGCPSKFGEIRDSLKAKEKHITAIELPEIMSLDYLKVRCPAFDKGKACPYNIPSLKGLGDGCPQSAESKCQFRDVKNVGEFKEKMGEMRDICKRKTRRDEAFEVICKSNDEGVERIGHCYFNHNHCELKTDLEGKPIA